MQVCWFKRDLRLSDHLAFFNACRNTQTLGPALCIYIHEPGQISLPTHSRAQQAFLWECLDSLHQQLAACGGQLYEFCGPATQVFTELLAHFELSHVHSTLEITDAFGYSRDQAVASLLKSHHVSWAQYPQHNVARGGQLQAGFGEYFGQAQAQALKNPYGKNLQARLLKTQTKPLDSQLLQEKGLLPSRAAVPLAPGKDLPQRLPGGRIAAERALGEFFTAHIDNYPRKMSSALTAFDACSRLSVYLSLGVLSDFEVLFEANRSVNLPRLEGRPTARQQHRQSSVLFWLDRMQWRQGYFARMEADPTIETAPSPVDMRCARTDNPGHLQAWETGHTGFPYVDACIRALNSTGYLNMRARGMVASFAMMQLWLPWQTVGNSLARRFLDYEPAIHWNQIRIHAGSWPGAPLMMYCPIKQSEDQDPAGEFITRHIPELKPLLAQPGGTALMHRPWLSPHFESLNYPTPVVCPDSSYSLARQRHAGQNATASDRQPGLF